MLSKPDPNKPKKKRGRPRIPLITPDIGDLESKLPPKTINWEQVMYWIDIGASEAEIAGSFHVSVSTLNRKILEHTGLNFNELKEKVSGPSKLRVRNNQLRLSEKNAAMAIWMGKMWLGQRDPDKGDTILISSEGAAAAMQQILDKTKNPLNIKEK